MECTAENPAQTVFDFHVFKTGAAAEHIAQQPVALAACIDFDGLETGAAVKCTCAKITETIGHHNFLQGSAVLKCGGINALEALRKCDLFQLIHALKEALGAGNNRFPVDLSGNGQFRRILVMICQQLNAVIRYGILEALILRLLRICRKYRCRQQGKDHCQHQQQTGEFSFHGALSLSFR